MHGFEPNECRGDETNWFRFRSIDSPCLDIHKRKVAIEGWIETDKRTRQLPSRSVTFSLFEGLDEQSEIEPD